MTRLDDIRRRALKATPGAHARTDIEALLVAIHDVQAIAEDEIADPWDEHTEALAWRVLLALKTLTAEVSS